MNKFRISLSVTVEQIADNGLGTKLDVMSKSGVLRSIASFDTIKSLGADGFKGALDEFVSNVHGVLVFDPNRATLAPVSEVVQFTWERDLPAEYNKDRVASAVRAWIGAIKADEESLEPRQADTLGLLALLIDEKIVSGEDNVVIDEESAEHDLVHLFTQDGNVIAVFPDGRCELHA